MKTIINTPRVLFVCLFTFFCVSPWTMAASTKKKDLVVFFVHGLQGDTDTFCQFQDILPEQVQKYLAANNIDSNVLTASIGYNTNLSENYVAGEKTYKKGALSTGAIGTKEADLSKAQKELQKKRFISVEVFASQVADEVLHFYKQHGLSQDTPYAFVLHSQGGLVGTKYVQKFLMDTRKNRFTKLPTNLKYFITLGSPLHGSPGANLLDSGFLLNVETPIDDWIRTLSGTPNQATDLAIGSTSIYQSMLKWMGANPETGIWKNPVKGDIQFYSVIGKVEFDDMPSKLAQLISMTDIQKWENNNEMDAVVDAASARLDFNYCVMKDHNADPKKIKCGTTQLLNPKSIIPSFLVTSHAHTLEPPAAVFEDDLKCVRRSDLSEGKGHVVLDYVRQIILSEYYGLEDDLEQDVTPRGIYRMPENNLRNFISEISVFFFPEEARQNRGPENNSMELEIVETPDGPENYVEIMEVDRAIMFHHSGFNNHKYSTVSNAWLANRMSYFHQGRMYEDSAATLNTVGGVTQGDFLPQSTYVTYRFSHPGFEPLEFKAKVTASMTTHSRIFMTPWRPMVALNPEQSPVPMNQDITDFKVTSLDKNMASQCIMGTVAPFTQKRNVRKAKFYQSFDEPTLPITEVKNLPEDSYRNDAGVAYTRDESRYVRVIGRYKGKSKSGQDVDRYLVIDEDLSRESNGNGEDFITGKKSHWDHSKLAYGKESGWENYNLDHNFYVMGWYDVDDIDLLQVEFLPLSKQGKTGRPAVSGMGCPQFSY